MGTTVPAMALGLTSARSRRTSGVEFSTASLTAIFVDLRFATSPTWLASVGPTGESHWMSIQCRSVVRWLVVATQCCQRILGRTGYLALGGTSPSILIFSLLAVLLITSPSSTSSFQRINALVGAPSSLAISSATGSSDVSAQHCSRLVLSVVSCSTCLCCLMVSCCWGTWLLVFSNACRRPVLCMRCGRNLA
jgi:hypothetical protein